MTPMGPIVQVFDRIARLTAERDEWIQRADRAEARFAAAWVALKWDEGRMASERAAYQANLAAVLETIRAVNTQAKFKKVAAESVLDTIIAWTDAVLSRLGTVEKR